MVKSVLGVSHRGFTDWLIQRISAIIMAIYSLGLIGFFVTHPYLAFYEWHGLFQSMWMKIATLLFFISLLFHAWIGMWTILTDYVKPTCLRLILEVLVFLSLLSFFFATLLILWGL